LEDIDLANQVLKEPVPKKIEDFRHHPLYVLKRHLSRHEILMPTAVHVSALTSGKGMKLKTETVYKQKDVIPCFSAREWFRRGRIIKEGEQPVIHKTTGRRRSESSNDEDSSTPLYTERQTELYIPQPVENGVVPKNNYGNIDIYTPSMVPAGGTHIIRPSIALAAQFAGIDYADAVTGFDYVKNKASVRLNGIIVAKENEDGLLTIWEGMMDRVKDEEERRRVRTVLDRWRRFFVKMGVRRDLNERHGQIVGDDAMEIIENDEEDGGGGFLLGAVQDRMEFEMASSFQQGQSTAAPAEDQDDGGGFLPIDTEWSPSGSNMAGSAKTGDDITSSLKYQNLQGEESQPPEKKDILSNLNNDKALDSGYEVVDVEDEGGGFMQEDDSDKDGFVYDDEDGLL
jgi:xeroderma pigmentosum group C-complementing protein